MYNSHSLYSTWLGLKPKLQFFNYTLMKQIIPWTSHGWKESMEGFLWRDASFYTKGLQIGHTKCVLWSTLCIYQTVFFLLLKSFLLHWSIFQLYLLFGNMSSIFFSYLHSPSDYNKTLKPTITHFCCNFLLFASIWWIKISKKQSLTSQQAVQQLFAGQNMQQLTLWIASASCIVSFQSFLTAQNNYDLRGVIKVLEFYPKLRAATNDS